MSIVMHPSAGDALTDDPSQWHTSHFDLLDDYDGELPEHVVNYLNDVKTLKTANVVRKFGTSTGLMKGLDVGCGTGNHALSLQELIPGCTVDGLDVSTRQLNKAREKGFPNQLIHAPMYATGIPDESYDFIVAVNSIHHLKTRQLQRESFSEFHRILKPRGILVVHEMNVSNILMRLYMKYVFPHTRSIDDGTELFLRELPFGEDEFDVCEVDFFTFVPDFTPRLLMGSMVAMDKRLSRGRLSKFGAHVMWVLERK
jgi:SAM-dependent methyltransferase